MTVALRRERDRGAVAVEFALVFPLAIVILAFTTALGLRVFWSSLSDNAARSAARYAAVPFANGTYPTDDQIKDHVKNAYGGLLGTPTSVVILNCRSYQPTDESLCETEDNRAPTPPGRAGDLVTVTIKWQVPGIQGMQSLVNAIPGFDVSGFSSVTQTARARRE